MTFYKRISAGDTERVLVFRRNRFIEILAGQTRTYTTFTGAVTEERHSLANPVFTSDWAGYLVKYRPDVVAEHFVVVETNDAQVAVVSLDGKLFRVIGPGSRVLVWKALLSVSVETIDVNESPEIDKNRTLALKKLGLSSLALMTSVEEDQAGLLYLDNRFEKVLSPGIYAYWTARSPRVVIVDLRRQTLEVTGQEILTRDKVTLRVNITADYQVEDALQAGTSVKSYIDHLYRLLQLALRRTLAQRSLDEVLADRVDVAPEAAEAVRVEMAALGVEIGSIALKDVILPGEIRDILNQVVAAEKQAQANLIRRREETAATRSLLNTANLMKDNPVLMRLKELETLEKLTEKVGHLTVHGGFETLLTRLLEPSNK